MQGNAHKLESQRAGSLPIWNKVGSGFVPKSRNRHEYTCWIDDVGSTSGYQLIERSANQAFETRSRGGGWGITYGGRKLEILLEIKLLFLVYQKFIYEALR